MEPTPTNSVFGPTPQQGSFCFPNGVTFFSEFDSGNLALVEQISTEEYHLWTATDCAQTLVEANTRTWFYFEVRNASGLVLTLVLKNLNNQGKLMREGMKPVFRRGMFGQWERLLSDLSYRTNLETNLFELTFAHKFERESEFFAFSYPWSYAEHLLFLEELEKRTSQASIYWHRTILTYSAEGRRCDILTISSLDGLTSDREPPYPGLFPQGEPMSHLFSGKKIVFLTARVHPGESPASHMMNGFLNWLVSGEVRARELLKNVVVKVVPMLNPDGVYRGYYRTGITGANENRFYLNPNPSEMPIIWAVREIFSSYQSNILCYIDLHAHATKPGCFVFGNHIGEFTKQVETMLFAKLMEINSQHFDLGACCFNEREMMVRDKGTNLSKEGCGRVVMYQLSKSPLCFTLECNYNSGKSVHSIPSSGLADSDVVECPSQLNSAGLPLYDIKTFEGMGRSMGFAILDYLGGNPYSRMKQTEWQTLARMRLEAARAVAEMVPYRNFTDIRNNRKTEEGLQSLLRGDPLRPKSSKDSADLEIRSLNPEAKF